MPELIYIAGYGRSGSTVLDMVLDRHEAMVGAGELVWIFDKWERNDLCSCQRRYRECPFWSCVMEHFFSIMPDSSVIEAARITHKVENGVYVWRLFSGAPSELHQHYGEIWRAMLEAIATVSQASIIVDSSKTTHLIAGRPIALARLGQINVRLLHLVRDPRAVMWSSLRGSNRLLESGQSTRTHGRALRALIGWCITNLTVETMRLAGFGKVLRVRYEDYVTDAGKEVSRIAAEFGVDWQPLAAIMEQGSFLSPGHGVAGNRLRRQKGLHIRADNEWKTKLPNYARRLAWLSWPIMRQYGYTLNG